MSASRPAPPRTVRARPRVGEPDPLFSVVSAAAESPERTAVVVDGRSVRYADLAPQVVARAARIRKHLPDARAGYAIAVEPRNDLDTVVTVHAALALDTPIFLLHPRRSSAELRRQLDIVRPAITVRRGEVLPGAKVPRRYPGAGAILFTSGTSGPAKAAVLSRRALEAASRASAKHLGWVQDDRWLLAIPPAHIGGLSVILRCLAGRSAVVLGGSQRRFSVPRLARDVALHRVTLLSLVPTQLHRVVDEAWRPPNHLRAVLVGGGPVTDALIERARELGIAALPTYGLTEASAQVATNPIEVRPRNGKIGVPLPGVQIRVVDGEIQVAGPTVFDGYALEGQDGASSTDDADADKARVESALLPDGFFPTGDLGAIDEDGWLSVHGRRGDLIITGGENVHPLEVEQALERSTAIAHACVFGVADPEWGQRVAAVLVPRGTAEAALAAVDELELADYARPRLVTTADELPQNEVGKVDRRRAQIEFSPALRER